MSIQTKDPANNQILQNYNLLTPNEIGILLKESHHSFLEWKTTSFDQRARIMMECSRLLIEQKAELAQLISDEMGKTLTEARSEIEKCANTCEYYAANTKNFLKSVVKESDASESYISYEPLGVILAVMPWNFPFWQLFRFVAPALMAGNSVLLKHASNVTGCSLAIEDLLLNAGIPKGVFKSLVVGSDQVEHIIANKHVKAVTLTGSEKAGEAVASVAGKYIKKCVLELGGSDPFIVLSDADLTKAINTGFKSRMLNGGQSCIAAKRFIVESSIYDQFVDGFLRQVQSMEIYDKGLDSGQIVPIAKESILIELLEIIEDAVKKGAKLISGGQRIDRSGNWLEPTILSRVTKGMRAYHEELFGPIAVMYKVDNADEAIALANDSEFGLGATVFTQDTDLAKKLAIEINSGAVYINGMVKSDPRLPFGGINKSGYGRELSREGILEFVNIKTVWIK